MKTGSLNAIILSSAIIALAACSSNTVTTAPAPAPAATDTPAPEPDPTPAVAVYPDGPYGNAVGQVLPDFELVGYLRKDAKGLATSAALAPVKVSDIRAQAGDVKYMLIHVSAFWCGICRAAVEDLVSAYPTLSSKAIFVDLLEEGQTPDDVTTKANLDAWIKGLTIPYTAVRDPDGAQWRTRTKVGRNKTALLVDLTTMKIIEKSEDDYTVVLDKLKSLK